MSQNNVRAYKTRGIVMRARNLGEADKIVTFFTLDSGKLDAVAKGVRRSRSHLAGRLEFASEVQLGVHRGRSLDVIVSADLVSESWNGIVQPAQFAAASVVIEIADALCEPNLAMPDVYALLKNALHAIASAEDPLALVPRFSLRFLALLGIAPPADRCVRCGAELVESAWLDEASGGFAGPECRERWREALTLDRDDLGNLAALSAPRGAGAALTARARVGSAIERLIAHHLGRLPKAGSHASEFVKAAR